MAEKIYAKARFAYNNKSLEWWESNNPVLENGEPGIVSDATNDEWLKIGDGKTSWNDLEWKKGPQGEPGKDAVTDQNYNPESKNAQSGVAVKEALQNKPTIYSGTEVYVAPYATGQIIYYDTSPYKVGDKYFNTDHSQLCICEKIEKVWVNSLHGSTYKDAVYWAKAIPQQAVMYDPESYDLQTGRTVAEAVSTKMNKFGEVLESTTSTSNGDTDTKGVMVDLTMYDSTEINAKELKINGLTEPTDPKQASNKEYVDENVGNINAVLAAIIEGSSVLPSSIINKVIAKAAAGVETQVGSRFVTAVAVRDTGSITVEPNAAYCIISNSESGKIVVYDRITEEPVEFTGKIIGMITGNYGDSNPASVLGLLGIYSSAVITKGTYLAVDSSKSATFSWEGEATVITVKNIKGE